ncbi:hypothetical protein MKY84_08690 [Chryseomicrobium sp. FSL W7-1435]|uniref:hypothetical protein n=1 Tax=Chryseomicrobium sp. FSL W7-1435 TaxID=2921704 RepID=UPI00315AA997
MKSYSILLVVLLAACSPLQSSTETTETTTSPTDSPTTNQPSSPQQEVVEEQPDLHTYFMPNQSAATFEGMGNEYATYTLNTQHLYENYIGTLEDNGGTVVQRIYRIEDTRIVKIFEEAEAYDADFPPLTELEAMPELETYLSLPFEEGNEFNGWTITETSGMLTTPYQTFENVITLTREGEDQSTIERHFVEGFGEVKRVFRMPAGESEEFEVTSSLLSID